MQPTTDTPKALAYVHVVSSWWWCADVGCAMSVGRFEGVLSVLFGQKHSMERMREKKGLGREGKEQLEGLCSPLNPVAGSGSSLQFNPCVTMGTS